ncbi:MAG: zinc-dependent alcohol dehydrogenase family protein [Rubellimicrobium sp.]|nr:zinc-dependent alcohol dehydrogenase family protein [Rubellimicrobium sp.]
MPRIWTIPAYTGYPGLTLSDEPIEDPGPGEVRLRVQAFALNWGDMDLMRDNYSFSFPRFPARVGIEAAGVIEALGEGVMDRALGEAVGTLPYFYWNRGVSGDQAIVDARYLAPTPPGLSAVEGASIWMQFLTAYYPLCEITPVGPDSAILITAGTSTAGASAIEIARMRGARILATTRDPANAAYLRALGADEVLVTDGTPLAPRIRDATGGRGVDLAFDPVGAGLIGDYSRALAKGARIYFYGTLDTQPPQLTLMEMFQSNAVFHPYSVFNYVEDPAARARGIAFVTEAIAAGRLRPRVDRVFPMEGYRDAFDYLRAPRLSHGKVVIETGL